MPVSKPGYLNLRVIISILFSGCKQIYNAFDTLQFIAGCFVLSRYTINTYISAFAYISVVFIQDNVYNYCCNILIIRFIKYLIHF